MLVVPLDCPLLGFRRSALRRLLPMFTESTTICLSAFITSTYYTRIVIIQQREAPDRFHPLPGSRSRCTLYRDWRASVRSSGCVYRHGSCVQLYCTERTAGKHVAGACYSPGGEEGLTGSGASPWAAVLSALLLLCTCLLSELQSAVPTRTMWFFWG